MLFRRNKSTPPTVHPAPTGKCWGPFVLLVDIRWWVATWGFFGDWTMEGRICLGPKIDFWKDKNHQFSQGFRAFLAISWASSGWDLGRIDHRNCSENILWEKIIHGLLVAGIQRAPNGSSLFISWRFWGLLHITNAAEFQLSWELLHHKIFWFLVKFHQQQFTGCRSQLFVFFWFSRVINMLTTLLRHGNIFIFRWKREVGRFLRRHPKKTIRATLEENSPRKEVLGSTTCHMPIFYAHCGTIAYNEALGIFTHMIPPPYCPYLNPSSTQ